MHANTPSEEGDAFVGGLTKGQNSQESPWSVVLSLNGKPTKFEIDTGAEVSAISQRAHREIGSPKLSLPERTLRGPSNDELSVKGQFTATLGNGNREVEQELFVVKDLHKHLLGRPAIEACTGLSHPCGISPREHQERSVPLPESLRRSRKTERRLHYPT